MATGSKMVVYAALIGNGLIAITKFGAASFTGSSAMFSEAIHSLVDTGNQGLLLYGMIKAQTPADERHPFGYGREIYFWAFIVAMLIFAVGGGVSVYEGIHKIQHPKIITNPMVNYIVLGLAIVFEGCATFFAYREFNRTRGDKPYIRALRSSKDPAIFTVLMEDTAAIIGLVVALVGVALAGALDMPVLDGVASVIIGVILICTAIFLALESKALLIGESAEPQMGRDIRLIIQRMPEVDKVHAILTQHLGPRQVLINMSLDFKDDLSAEQVENAVGSLRQQIRQSYPIVSRVFIEAASMYRHKAASSDT
jgi:cation diffusion facilitator family transporter